MVIVDFCFLQIYSKLLFGVMNDVVLLSMCCSVWHNGSYIVIGVVFTGNIEVVIFLLTVTISVDGNV